MKEKLTILLSVLFAMNVSAMNFYTFNVKVKRAEFMTNPTALSVRLVDKNNGESFLSYNSQSDSYTGGNYFFGSEDVSLQINYNGMCPYFQPISLASENVTVEVDFTDCHKATFKGPEGYEFSSPRLVVEAYNTTEDYDRYWNYSIENGIYLLPGTYRWVCTLENKSTNLYYVAYPQEFVMGNEDQEVVYKVNPSNYCKVTVQGGGFLSLSTVSHCGFLLVGGKDINSSLMVGKGEYLCTTYISSTESTKYVKYASEERLLKVESSDITIQASSYTEAEAVPVQLTGDLRDGKLEYPEINVRSSTNPNDRGTYYSFYGYNPDEGLFEGLLYLPQGEYEYQLFNGEIYNSNRYVFPLRGQIRVPGNQGITVDMSTYTPVTLKGVDKYGGSVSLGEIRVTSAEKETGYFRLWSNDKIYLLPGKYTVSAEIGSDKGNGGVFYQDITVGNAPQDILLVCNVDEYYPLVTSIESGEVTNWFCKRIDYSYDGGIEVVYSSQGREYGETRIQKGDYYENGPAFKKGTYDYFVFLRQPYSGDGRSNVGLQNKMGQFTITGDKDRLSIGFDDYGIISASVVSGSGQPLQLSKGVDYLVYEGNKVICHGWGRANGLSTLFLSAGTYRMVAIPEGGEASPFAPTETMITVSAGEPTVVQFALTPREINKCVVRFDVEDRSGNKIHDFNIQLDGYENYGFCDGFGAICGVTRNETQRYVITAPGCESYEGTLNISETNPWYNTGCIYQYVRLRGSNVPNGIETTEIKENEVSVYPTSTKDYFYIRAEEKGLCTIQLFSMTGLKVYTERMELCGGDTPVYIGHLPEGVYVLSLSCGSLNRTFKIVRQ